MKLLENKLGGVFSEASGKTSSTRFMVFLVVAVILFNWTWFNITNNTIAQFDMQDLMVLGGAFGFKAWQRGKEGVTNGKKPI